MDQIAQVRRFNRTVTERVGALDDRYLARDRPLGESRVLWEVGDAGADVRALRARLGLDSGYLSRLLRSLVDAGLVSVEPGRGPARAHRAPHRRGPRRARAARPAQRRAGRRHARAAGRRRADAARRGDGRGRAPPHRGTGGDRPARTRRAPTRGTASTPTPPSSTGASTAASTPAPGARSTTRPCARRAGCCCSPRSARCPWAAGSCATTTAGGPRSSACGSHRTSAGSASGAGSWATSSSARPSTGRSSAWTRTERCARRSRCTAPSGWTEIAAYNDNPYAHHWFEKRLAA